MENNKKERFYTQSSRLQFVSNSPNPPTDTKDQPQTCSTGVLKGYAIVWNQLSTDRYAADGSTYKVRLMPNSGNPAPVVHAYYEHDSTHLLGNTANNSLKIMPADEVGIPIEINLPDTTSGHDVGVLVRDNYLEGMSFTMTYGFEQKTVSTEKGETIYNVQKFTYDEVTICSDPAFKATSIESVQTPDTQDDEADDYDEDESYKAENLKELELAKEKNNNNTLYLARLALAEYQQ